ARLVMYILILCVVPLLAAFTLHTILFTSGFILGNRSVFELSWLIFNVLVLPFEVWLLPLYVMTTMFFGILVVALSVHGRELAVSPMECQINTQSAPDAAGLSRIVTLVRRTYVKSLRHGIYDHEDCAKTISNWVRSQLDHVPSS